MKELDEVLNYDIFKSNYKTLKDISIDKANNEYLVNAQIQAVDFDKIKDDYHKKIGINSGCTKSADALMINCDEILMIEFKNGELKDFWAIKEKMLHSLIMFCDITDKTTKFTRKNMTFILVYNEEKNKSKYEIRTKYGDKIKKPLVRFGLNKFPQSFYKEIRTMTTEQFEEFIIERV